MKRIVNQHITRVMWLVHKARLPSHMGSYFVTPKPGYISQFIGIYPSSITPQDSLTNVRHIREFGAKDSAEFTAWAWRDCGIVCVKMILDTKGKAKDRTIMDLTREGIALNGYVLYENGQLVDRGWFHRALVDLLQKHGVVARMRKWQSIESVATDILANKLVMLSVSPPSRRSIKEDGSFGGKPNASFGGHLVLAVGVKMDGKRVEGIYVHDPRGLKKLPG